MTAENGPAGSGLTYRDAYADFAHVPSDLVARGADDRTPVVSISIPTFRRPALLVETVQSALEQRFSQPYEIVVVDNDPASNGAQALIDRLPQLKDVNFRYFVNRENIGQFPNHNRCIEVSRGEWVTILNDDDLLDANGLEVLFAELTAHPDADGLAPRKRMFDDREVAAPNQLSGTTSQFLSRRINFGSAWRMVKGGQLLTAFRSGKRRIAFEYAFGGKLSRRITPDIFFWGNVLGNGAGFIFRKDKALAMGGFYPEDFPSADFWFYARFASRFHLRQHRAELASVRMTGENTSVTTVKEQLQKGYLLQRSLVGKEVPLWWRRLLPMVMAWHLVDFQNTWKSNLTPEELEKALQVRLPKHRPRVLSWVRLMLTRSWV